MSLSKSQKQWEWKQSFLWSPELLELIFVLRLFWLCFQQRWRLQLRTINTTSDKQQHCFCLHSVVIYSTKMKPEKQEETPEWKTPDTLPVSRGFKRLQNICWTSAEHQSWMDRSSFLTFFLTFLVSNMMNSWSCLGFLILIRERPAVCKHNV